MTFVQKWIVNDRFSGEIEWTPVLPGKPGDWKQQRPIEGIFDACNDGGIQRHTLRLHDWVGSSSDAVDREGAPERRPLRPSEGTDVPLLTRAAAPSPRSGYRELAVTSTHALQESGALVPGKLFKAAWLGSELSLAAADSEPTAIHGRGASHLASGSSLMLHYSSGTGSERACLVGLEPIAHK